MNWEDIDEEREVIHYRRKKTKRAFSTPIFPWLKPLLTKLRAAAGTNPRGPVFKVKNVKNTLRGATERLGLPHLLSGICGQCASSAYGCRVSM